MTRRPTLSTAKKRAWAALSKCIRYGAAEDGLHAACVTCDAVKPWKELQAGHFINAAQGNSTRFDPRNIHTQCYRCNINLGGNGARYYPWMLKHYGEGVIAQLEEKQRQTVKFTAQDYLDAEAFWKSEFQKMQEARAAGHIGFIKVEGYL